MQTTDLNLERKIQLWKKRLFEAETGMNNYIVQIHGNFFEALGLVAEKRMKTYGVVTSIPVCLWRCIRNNKISNKY